MTRLAVGVRGDLMSPPYPPPSAGRATTLKEVIHTERTVTEQLVAATASNHTACSESSCGDWFDVWMGLTGQRICGANASTGEASEYKGVNEMECRTEAYPHNKAGWVTCGVCRKNHKADHASVRLVCDGVKVAERPPRYRSGRVHTKVFGHGDKTSRG